jgi:hypothetical protein
MQPILGFVTKIEALAPQMSGDRPPDQIGWAAKLAARCLGDGICKPIVTAHQRAFE